MNKQSLKRIGIMFFVFLLLCTTFTLSVSAYDEGDYVVGTGNQRIPIPITYNPVSVDSYLGDVIGELSTPSDIFITKDDRIYIVDSGQNRIVSMDSNYENCKVVNIFHNADGSTYTLNNPQGLYVYDNGDLLIADTDNGKIVHSDADGNIIKTYVQPDSDLYDSTYPFKPIKVYVNLTDQIYVLNKEDYHGFIVLDIDNDFKGYIATTKVDYSFTLKILRLVATEEQLDLIGQVNPPVHTNFFIDDENSIYTVTANTEKAQMERFSVVGASIYPFTGEFGENRSDYVLQYYGKTFTDQEFQDVTADEAGTVTMIDAVTGRIYQYDSEGNMLTCFGGTGKWVGNFTGATGMAQDSQGNLYVIDGVQNTIHKLEPTAFINAVHTALGYYYNGNYSTAAEYWDEVLDLCPSYPMAHIGKGNALLKNKQYTEAMAEFKKADYKAGYSSAFDKHELEIVRQYFGIVLVVVIVVILAVVLLVAYLRRRYRQTYERQSRFRIWNNKGRLRILLGTLFDPNEGYREIRRNRSEFDPWTPLVIYLLVIVAKVMTLFVTHYPFRKAEVYNINLASELLVIFIPLLTWVIANYMVTTIRSGEVKMKEVFAASAYCMLPYVIVSIPLSLVSNIMSTSNAGLYNALVALMWIWVGLMFFVSTMSMNSYGFLETVGIIFITLFACVFMWMVLLLIFMLGEQVYDFFADIVSSWKIYFAYN